MSEHGDNGAAGGPNGRVLVIESGEYRAVLTSAGATLAALTHAGDDLMVPFDADTETGDGYQGRSLLPWPNRITGSRYTWAGATYEVPCNESATGAALHGSACWSDWAVGERTPSAVTFALTLPASPGYLWPLAASVEYALDAASGLTITLTATNTGPDAAPVGLSTHPYLTCGAPADECTLTVPAGGVLEVDSRLSPVRVSDVWGTVFDLRVPAPLAGVAIDNAFTDLPEHWAVDLVGPRYGVRMTAASAWLQVYTGEKLGRRGVAVEPMTCPPDAFNGDHASVELAPGGTRTLVVGITALRP